MAAGRRHCPASWADLQPELVGLVLRRLPSLADRVRLAAVCRPWRHSARLEPAMPPPFPWLTLRDGTFLSIPDRKIYRLPSVPTPGNNNSRCIGSVGNWLFLEQHQHTAAAGEDDGRGSSGSPVVRLSVLNPFSMDVVQLPDADTIYRGPCFLLKLVLLSSSSSSMDHLSPDSLFAVLVAGKCRFESMISICQPPSTAASAFRVPDLDERIGDVAFVDGKLYALSPKKLYILEVEYYSSGGKCCKPRIISSMKSIANDVIHQAVASDSEKCNCMCLSYLVESSGKLLHVMRLVGGLSLSPGEDRTKFCRTFSFHVFEVDLATSSSRAQWRRLDSLEGKALFLGPCSKALHASECDAEADCIYFMCDYSVEKGDCPVDPFRDSGVFNMTNNTITPLLPETMIMQVSEDIAKERSADKSYSARPSWFFSS